MYSINNNRNEMKEILYSEEKNSKNKFNYKYLASDLNKKNLHFSKGNIFSKFKDNSSLNSYNINNVENNLIKLNSEYSPNDYNNYTFNVKSNNSKNKTINKQDLNQEQNNNSNFHYKMTINGKIKEKYKNVYNSTGKQEKNFVRNFSGGPQIKKNINNNNQKNTLRKETSYLNKIFYNKNNNFFHEIPDNYKNRVQFNYNINKINGKNYKEILSKSSFNNSSINNINILDNNNFTNNYNYMISNQSNSSLKDSAINNSKLNKNQKGIKYVKPNKIKYKIFNYDINNGNNMQNIIEKKFNKNSVKKEKVIFIKNNNNNKNINYQVNNNLIKNDKNIILKIKTNSNTPLNNNNNCVFTNPNNTDQYNMIRDSLICENKNNSNYRLSVNSGNKTKKLNDKSCPKFIPNYSNNNYTNINNINSNNNYIVNVNKYINIIDKKNKIIRKGSNGNGINIANYNSYKNINSSNNNNKKSSNDKNYKKDINIKYNNYLNIPNEMNYNKYKNLNKNKYIPKSNTKDKYINQNFNTVNKNNLRTNTQIENLKFNKIVEFKKLKTPNNINKNNIKNVKIYQNENIYSNIKNPRKKNETDVKKCIIDSNSFKYINKSNTNSSLMKGINNNKINNSLFRKNKNIYNKFYSDSFSLSSKNINSSHRNSHNNYHYNFNTNINNNERNNNYKKGRNENNNLEIIFKPQTIGQGQKLDFHLTKTNTNRNADIKIENRDSKTLGISDMKKNNLKSNIRKNDYININLKNNFNLIKLMKTVKEYKNKSNKARYENQLKENKNNNNNLKYNINNNYITNIINNINDERNILNKKKIKNSYNQGYSEIINLKAFNENKILQNINQNTLTMYSIYILSHYFTDFHKIGLSRIVLLNENNEPIPVICTNNNCGQDTNKLFNISGINKNKNYNKPFITEFKNNIYINFYINNIQSNHIKCIQIQNYTDLKNKISPVGKIEIFQAKKRIFKGILNSHNISNILLPSPKTRNEINNNNNNKDIQELNDINEISIINDRHYSLSKYRSMEEENNQNEENDLIINSEHDNFYTTRGPLFKGLPNLLEDYNYKNINLENYDENNYDEDLELKEEINEEKDYNINMNNFKNMNNFEIDSLLSLELSKTNNNKINSHNDINKNNTNIANNNYEIYNTNNNNSINKLSYSNSNNNINKNNNTLNKNNNSNSAFFNLFRKTYNKNELDNFDQIFKTSVNKKRDYSSFNLKNSMNNKNKTAKKEYYINNDINNDIDNILTNNIDINTYNQEDESFSKINLNNDNMDNYDNNNIYTNTKSPNYIEFNKIRFIISSNYGHHKYVGLTGIELFNVKGEPINIETALTIGALPKDLRTLYNDEKENRIFENVFNKINNTNDSDNMWVTKLKKNNPLPFIELYFKEKLRISKIRIYNYNERDKLNIGAKTIELYLDDEYYNTIYLKQGTGEIASGFIKIKKNNIDQENNEFAFDLDDSDISNNEDFGQDITFPIIDIIQNHLNTNHYSNNNLNDNNSTINNQQIKFASFLYKQSYETPYLPCGYYLKLVFSSNYFKGVVPFGENDLKYSDIGLNKIEIYDENGKNILDSENDFDNPITYKIISNCEILKDEDDEEKKINNKIIINGGDIGENKNGNNCLFYIFDKPQRISYIKFYPLEDDNKPILNSVKDIKIFSDCKIIFEGTLYLEKPTIVLFTCERKIIYDINEDYLTKEINIRNYKEEKNDEYISLILN